MTDFEREIDIHVKVDLSINGSKTAELMKLQREKEKHLYPLKIDKVTTIYVPEEKCNEEYKELYIRKREGNWKEVKEPKPTQTVHSRKVIDLKEIESMFADGYTAQEVGRKLCINPTTIGRKCKEAGIPIPNNRSRTKIFLDKGMSFEEIAKKLGVSENTVRGYVE